MHVGWDDWSFPNDQGEMFAFRGLPGAEMAFFRGYHELSVRKISVFIQMLARFLDNLSPPPSQKLHRTVMHVAPKADVMGPISAKRARHILSARA
jgi:hypothetical protein